MKKTSIGLLVVLASTAVLASQPLEKPPAPAQPSTPAEALKHFKLAPGLRIELVAAEPLVQSPVAIAFDAHGRLWVVEMPDYPNGPPKGKPPEGRIRVLEDKDGDGYFESATTFASELLFANGLLPWKDGVIVTAAPHIISLQDPKHTGHATEKNILFEGFAAKNPQLRVSHPTLGLDGWIYCANGLSGGKVIKAGVKDAKPINISGMDFRFDPLGDGYEAISGPGQFGNTFDDWGNRFVCDNRHHLRHVVLDNTFVRRNPFLAPSGLLEDISELPDGPPGAGVRIFPLSKNWTTSSLHEGHFTAACGVHIYRGSLLPKEYQGAAFTCDPTGNLVHMEILTPHGATFKSKPPREGVEFLASPDDWFRPVSMASGPDGALYIVDMCRAVIEHPEFMPPELQKRPDLTMGKDKGRIWRIVPEGHKTKAVRPNLSMKNMNTLTDALDNPDGWWRSTAARLLYENMNDWNSRAWIAFCLGSGEWGIISAKTPQGRVQSAWLLQKLGARSNVLDLLRDPNPKVREHGVLLASAKHGHFPGIYHLTDDPDPRVRYQIACVIGDGAFPEKPSLLAKLALAGTDDKWTRLAVASSAADCAGKLLEELLKARKELNKLPAPQRMALLQEYATLVGARQDEKELKDTFAVLAAIDGAHSIDIHMPAMTGLANGIARRGKRVAEVIGKLSDWAEKFGDEAAAHAAKPKTDPALRQQAVRYLAHVPLPKVETFLTNLITADPSQEIRMAAIRALAAHPERQVPTLILKSWRSYTPAVRREALEAMFRDPLWLSMLLNEIEAKRVLPGDIDPFRTRQLLAHNNPSVRERAQKLLRDSLPADRKIVMEKYQVALTMNGDPKSGREIFKKNCATCHKVAGIGIDVGPDIADSRTKTEAALLVDILNPNQAIDNNFVNYIVTTKSGRALTGLLAVETASSLTLKRAEGQTDIVLRQDIETIESTGVSLMPEGLEKTISVQDMADLLKFLKNWRYLDGAVPAGTTK